MTSHWNVQVEMSQETGIKLAHTNTWQQNQIKKSGVKWTEMGWRTSHVSAFQSCPGTLPHSSPPLTRGFLLLGRALCIFLFFFFFLFCSWISKTRARLIPAWPSVSVSYHLGAVSGWRCLAPISLCLSQPCRKPPPPRVSPWALPLGTSEHRPACSSTSGAPRDRNAI